MVFVVAVTERSSRVDRGSLFQGGVPERLWCGIAILAIAIGMLLLPQGAVAQQLASDKAPPPIQLTDRNGVDLKSGLLVRPGIAVAIGDPKAPSLRHAPFSINSKSGNTPIASQVRLHHCDSNATIDEGCQDYYTVILQDREATFVIEPSSYPTITGMEGDVLDLSNPSAFYVYATDGSKWEFSRIAVTLEAWEGHFLVGEIKRITQRDGSALVFDQGTGGTYQTMVTSSDGYRFLLSPYEARMVNIAEQYCDRSVSCAPSQASTHLDLSQRAYIGVDIITDAAGREYKTVITQVPNQSREYRITSPTGVEEVALATDFVIATMPSNGACPTQKRISAVTQFTNAFGSTSYTYSGDMTGRIWDGIATYNDNSTTQLHGGGSSFTDELGGVTTYDQNSGYINGWNSSGCLYTGSILVPTTLQKVTYPEVNAQRWDYIRGQVKTATADPKPGSGLASPAFTLNYDTGCSNYLRCNQPNFTLDERGNQMDFTYDPTTGLLLSQIAPPNSQGLRAETHYSYTQLQATYRQASGATPTLSGIPVWKLTQISTCATLARAQCVGTSDELQTSIEYDGNLRSFRETVRTGNGTVISVSTKSYNALGDIVAFDGPMPGTADTVYSFYNAVREKSGEIAPNPDAGGGARFVATRISYNGDGQVTLVERGTASGTGAGDLAAMAVTNQTATTYGIGGLKTVERASSGGVTLALTQYSYDGRGRLECAAMRMNPAAFGSLPGSACTLGTEGAHGPDRITRNVYDAAGQLLQVRRAVGTPLEQAYATYEYTPNGKRKTVIDANGNRAQMVHDGLDRQVRWSFPDKTVPASFTPTTPANALATAGAVSAGDYEEYGYDQAGNRTSVRRRDGRTLTFGYDALNRMTSKIVPDGCAPIQTGTCPAASATRDVYYSYDLRGLQTAARFDSTSGTDAVANGYDAAGRLTSSNTSMGGFSRTLGYQHDAGGNRTRVTHPDGVYLQYNRDALGRLASIAVNGTTGIIQMQYNAQGVLSEVKRGLMGGVWGAPTTYSYDGLSRLTGLTHDVTNAYDVTYGFGLNPASQIISQTRSNDSYAYTGYLNVNRSYARNGLNQYTSAGPATFTYDANGNLISDGTSSFSYDAENRMVTASGGWVLTYDPLGRLWQNAAGATDGSQMLWDGDELVDEYSLTGTHYSRQVHGGGEDDPLAMFAGSGTTSPQFYLADHQGSIVATADSGGNVTGVLKYDEYGIQTGNQGRFQYTGQIWLPLGMYYYKARMYSPTLGRFMQIDPIGYDDQINLYAYVGNDPVNNADPTGTCLGPFTAPCAVIGGAIVGGAARCAADARCRTIAVAGARWAIGEVVKHLTTSPTLGLPPTVLPSKIYDTDPTGKIRDENPGAVHVGDDELKEAIGDLDRSIARRRLENNRFPRGNPNGDPEDRRLNQRYRNHVERITRDESARDALRDRLRKIEEGR